MYWPTKRKLNARKHWSNANRVCYDVTHLSQSYNAFYCQFASADIWFIAFGAGGQSNKQWLMLLGHMTLLTCYHQKNWIQCVKIYNNKYILLLIIYTSVLLRQINQWFCCIHDCSDILHVKEQSKVHTAAFFFCISFLCFDNSKWIDVNSEWIYR